MSKIGRTRRAEIQRTAHQIRQKGQFVHWGAARTAATIVSELPDVRPLEAWRLAYGWSRPQVVASIAALYRQDGLAAPAINSSMLCRWEHGQGHPNTEYCQALCRIYRTRPSDLGLPAHTHLVIVPDTHLCDSQRRGQRAGAGPQYQAGMDNSAAHALAAVRESIQLAFEVEGPAGGALTQEQLHHAVQHFALNYAAIPPGLLASEVYRCRRMVAETLLHPQSATARNELRVIGGWLSALLGNLSFHRTDHTAANIHLRIAARLGATVRHSQLEAWALGAQSMVTRHQNRPVTALKLARQAAERADTPLRRAQITAWAELPALASLGRHDEARSAKIAAYREMHANPECNQSGRFGFDITELELHLAEAELALGNSVAAADHAQASLSLTTVGRPSWAAATLTLAQSEVQRRRPDQGAELALHVLDIIPPSMLRETSRQRLTQLDTHLSKLKRPGPAAACLQERLHTLPLLNTVEMPQEPE